MSGNLTDAFQFHNGAAFSTPDADHDRSSTNCARWGRGKKRQKKHSRYSWHATGWWYTDCQHVNLNGNIYVGMLWFNSDSNDYYQIQRARMLIRAL